MISIDPNPSRQLNRSCMVASQASPGQDKDTTRGTADGDDHSNGNGNNGDSGQQEHVDELLDEALDDTFPASDPVALTPGKEDTEGESEHDDDEK